MVGWAVRPGTARSPSDLAACARQAAHMAGAGAGGLHPDTYGAPYGSDPRLLTGLGGIPTLQYGPGDVTSRARSAESVALDDVVTTARTPACSWCSTSAAPDLGRAPRRGGHGNCRTPLWYDWRMMFLTTCAGCNAPGDTLCRRCRFALVTAHPPCLGGPRGPCGERRSTARRPGRGARPQVPATVGRRRASFLPRPAWSAGCCSEGDSRRGGGPGHLGAHEAAARAAERRASTRRRCSPGRSPRSSACRVGGCCTCTHGAPQSGHDRAARLHGPTCFRAPRRPAARPPGRRRGHHHRCHAARCRGVAARHAGIADVRCIAAAATPAPSARRPAARRMLQLASWSAPRPDGVCPARSPIASRRAVGRTDRCVSPTVSLAARCVSADAASRRPIGGRLLMRHAGRCVAPAVVLEAPNRESGALQRQPAALSPSDGRRRGVRPGRSPPGGGSTGRGEPRRSRPG